MRLGLATVLLASLFTAPVAAATTDRPVQFTRSVSTGGSLAIPLASKADLARVAGLDPATRAAIERSLDGDEFDYAEGSTLTFRGLGPWSRILVIGTGAEPLTVRDLQDVGGTVAQELGGGKEPLTIVTTTLRTSVPEPAAHVGVGTKLGGYSFDKYKSADPKKESATDGRSPILVVSASPEAQAAYERTAKALVDGVYLARNLAQEPANALYPETFVDQVRASLRGVPGVSIEVLDVPAMQRLGMGAILSVGRGSQRPPRMLLVHYRGNRDAPLVALAGKGITFDSGGISLKPGNGMWAMKGDMGGAAAVVGAVTSLAKSQAPVNVVGIAALAENMPGGSATRPGDVVKSYSGKTIEVLNTDAEGRLVLSDAVAYAERQYRPAAIVDIATLTGAVSTALGDEYAGVFSRNDALAGQLLAAGEKSGEELWRLPLHANYAKDMKSDIADIKNVVEGGGPGAGLGAHFIGYFVETTPWAHLDIAGVDMRSAALPTVPKGLSGFGVRLLDQFVRDFRLVPAASAAGGL